MQIKDNVTRSDSVKFAGTYTFRLAVSRNCESVGGQGSLCARIVENRHCPVVLENVDFFDSGNCVDSELLQR